MARGGSRPGAGRPPSGRAKVTLAPKRRVATKAKAAPPAPPKAKAPGKAPRPSKKADLAAAARTTPAEAVPLAPLEYMLKVMNDDRALPDRRDRMAVAAAPFVHGKVGESGKKDAKKAAAAGAAGGKFAPSAPPIRQRVN